MKLFTRTSILYLSVTALAFVLGSWLFYSFLNDLVLEEAGERLEIRKELIREEFERDSVVHISSIDDDIIVIPGTVKEYTGDTIMFDSLMGEELPFRVLHFPYEKNGELFHVMVKSPLLESDDLTEGMLTSLLVSLGILVVSIVLFLWLASRRIWKPFYETLDHLKNFKPESRGTVKLTPSRVKEFAELNAAIEKMSANTEASFQALKSFSENAAHEIQTPLAVIQSTTEVLLQDENLTEHQYNTISHLSSTTARLSNIVSTLLLLTRIENKQFQQDTPIDLSDIVTLKMELFHELFEQKNIQITTSVLPNVNVKLHKVLAEILVSNLIVNAVRHTKEGGKAEVILNSKEFSVRNSGEPLAGDSSRIFERFYKEDQSEISTGLGLSLVKMAADVSGMHISYNYKNGMHEFSLKF